MSGTKASTNYYKYNTRLVSERTRKIIQELPEFCEEYFRGISTHTSALTRLNYAYDLRLFFDYYATANFDNKTLKDITIEDLNKVTVSDIEKFLDYVSLYERNFDYGSTSIQILSENSERGKARKLSALRALFKYLFKKGYLPANVTELVDSPKIHEKPIIRLEPDEVSALLDEVENGNNLTERQKKLHEGAAKRDTAIITLLLGTGIRVSECVGLNIDDINFNENSIRVTRKGGNEVILYINDEVAQALMDYLVERKTVKAADTQSENALFLSSQRKRISQRAVQYLVKKYARLATPLKRITPHKLRSTYGTALYRESGDIYLVADVLGHKDVNTTRKHYAAISEDRRRMASEFVRLRDKDDEK